LFTKLHPEDTHAPWDSETLLEDYLEDEEAYPDSDSENRSSIASEEELSNESGSDDSTDFAHISNPGSGTLSSSPSNGYFIQHILSGSGSPRNTSLVHSLESISASDSKYVPQLDEVDSL